MRFMGRHGTASWGQALVLSSRIQWVGFCIFQWIKNCTFFCLRPVYRELIEAHGFMLKYSPFSLSPCTYYILLTFDDFFWPSKVSRPSQAMRLG